jgi:hypothetical protein
MHSVTCATLPHPFCITNFYCKKATFQLLHLHIHSPLSCCVVFSDRSTSSVKYKLSIVFRRLVLAWINFGGPFILLYTRWSIIMCFITLMQKDKTLTFKKCKKVQENTKHIITVSCVNTTGNYIYLKDTKHNLSSSCHPCWHFCAKSFVLNPQICLKFYTIKNFMCLTINSSSVIVTLTTNFIV